MPARFILFALLPLLFISCGGKKVPGPIDVGEFTFMGKTQTLTNAYVYDYNNDTTSRYYYLDLTTESIDVIREWECNTDQADAVSFRLNTPNDSTQISATYTFSSESDEIYTIWECWVLEGYASLYTCCSIDQQWTYHMAKAGELDYEINNDRVDISFSMTDQMGNEASGFYRGKVIRLD